MSSTRAAAKPDEINQEALVDELEMHTICWTLQDAAKR